MQALETRLYSARVHCDEKATDYGIVYFGNIVGLLGSILSSNLHKVECPQGFFLARFEIEKEKQNEWMPYNLAFDRSPRARVLYRCCKFIL